jgi:hypothetical protein
MRAFLLAVLLLLPAIAGAKPLGFSIGTSKPVVVDTSGGVPRVWLDFGGGESRAATYRGGSGTQVLEFAYDVVAGDFAPSGIVAAGEIDLAGGAIRDAAGNPLTLTFTPPNLSGVKVQTYRAAWTTDPVTSANASAAAFQITKPPPGATFVWQITSDGGGTLSGSGTIAASPHPVTGLDLSALADGTLTLTVTLTTPAGTGAARTATVAKNSRWTPADLGPALALWLDASDAATLTLEGSAVSEWRDKSGNGRHVGQALAASRPARALWASGRAVVAFDGDDVLATTGNFPITGNPEFSVFFVHQKTREGNGSVLGWGNVWGSLIAFGFLEEGTGGIVGFGYAGANTFRTSSAALDAPVVTAYVKTPGAIHATSAAYRDGANIATTGHSTNTPNIAAGPLHLGQWANYPNNRLVGSIAEAIILPTALAAPERERIEGYLAHKWGLQGNLPADHPWKAAPP